MPLITIFLSTVCKLDGGLTGSFKIDTFLSGKAVLSSIKAYFPSTYVKAVIT
jgi:hypothetical protein